MITMAQRDKAIARRYRSGETMEPIGRSQEPPITRERVRQILARDGVARRSTGVARRVETRKPEVVPALRRAADTGRPFAEVGAEHGLGKHAIYSVGRRLGLWSNALCASAATHGTRTRYAGTLKAAGCRCSACRRANADAQQAYLRRRRARGAMR